MKKASSETTEPQPTSPLDQDPNPERALQNQEAPDRDPDQDPERDSDSDAERELLGSGSRRSLSELLAGESHRDPRDKLFVDRNFPIRELELQSGVRWRRPRELCASPQFIVDGASRLDIRQGRLSDCWLLAAIASLSLHPELLQKVLQPKQNFQESYDGSFTFRFWQYGEWVEVCVDDLLPTQNGALIYLSSPDRHEFWSPLLEKAYAKLKGGYRALDMGFPHEAMVDMTGGVAEVLDVASLGRDLSTLLRLLLDKGALINCANSQGPLEQRNELGIMFRHAYALTAVETVKTSYGSVDLVRILNPWGNTEWEGPWSDMRGPEWKTVSVEEQKRLDRVSQEDGEFWMAVSDFRLNFQIMEVCHLSNKLGEPGSTARPWSCWMHHGSWEPYMSAGGPGPGGWFWQNPQFQLVLSEADGSSCSFVLALMQKHQRRRGINLSIALHVYPVRPHSTFLSPEELRAQRPLLCSPHYSPRREVVLRGALPPGRYIIIPSTSQLNQQGSFLLRVLTERGHALSPANMPSPQDSSSPKQLLSHQEALPSTQSTRALFKKHCNKGGCGPLQLFNLMTEALQGGALAGSEKLLALEHCKSMVVLMDGQGIAQLDWAEFQSLWDKICRWTDIFLKFDKNKTHRLEYQEIGPALKEAGIRVDELIMQLVGLRYTEPDMTVSYPGFLYLLMKLESMIQKFRAYDMAGLGSVTVSFRQWLHMTMYN